MLFTSHETFSGFLVLFCQLYIYTGWSVQFVIEYQHGCHYPLDLYRFDYTESWNDVLFSCFVSNSMEQLDHCASSRKKHWTVSVSVCECVNVSGGALYPLILTGKPSDNFFRPACHKRIFFHCVSFRTWHMFNDVMPNTPNSTQWNWTIGIIRDIVSLLFDLFRKQLMEDPCFRTKSSAGSLNCEQNEWYWITWFVTIPPSLPSPYASHTVGGDISRKILHYLVYTEYLRSASSSFAGEFEDTEMSVTNKYHAGHWAMPSPMAHLYSMQLKWHQRQFNAKTLQPFRGRMNQNPLNHWICW